MRKILCDRCGAEIPLTSKIGYVAVNWRAPSDESLMYENPYEGYDFCEQCMHDIVEVIDNICTIKTDISVIKAKTPETPEELARKFVDAVKENLSAPEPEEPEEEEIGSDEDKTGAEETKVVEQDQEKPEGRLADNPPPKQFVNLRELRELVKAGKKLKEIAEHFGISVASFYNYRKRAEAMWNAGML